MNPALDHAACAQPAPANTADAHRSRHAPKYEHLRARVLIASAREQLLKAAGLLPEPACSTLLAAESSLQFLD